MREFRTDSVPKPRGVAPFDLSLVPEGMALDIEIGCGVGLHPIRYATTHPDRYLVAIEHTKIKFEKFAGRLSHHATIPNLLAVHADAIEWITHFIPNESVDRYFLLYPNPWPKPRDEHKRWYAMPFMSQLIATLKPHGTLQIATNEPYYADGVREYFSHTWKLALLEERTLSGADITPRTHFERKYLSRGETCYDFVFTKR